MVGAMPDPSRASGLSENDDFFADKVFSALKKLGYAPPADFNAKIININADYGGGDYLSPKLFDKFDVSIFNYILRTRTDTQFLVRSQIEETMPSPHELKSADPWLEAALRRKSKLLVTFGREAIEVSPSDFVGDHFARGKSPYTLLHTEAIPLGAHMPNDGAAMNVMIHRDYQ